MENLEACWNMYASVKTNEEGESYKGLNYVDLPRFCQAMGMVNLTDEDLAQVDKDDDDYVSRGEVMKLVVRCAKGNGGFGKKEKVKENRFEIPQLGRPRKELTADLLLEVFEKNAVEFEVEGRPSVYGLNESAYAQICKELGYAPRNSDFDGLDADGSGYLTESEFFKFMVRMSQRTEQDEKEAEESIFIEESL